jgi:hypothetical protein
MPGTIFAASGQINWYETSVPQRSFVHCFQQGSPSVPTGLEYLKVNNASNGPAYIDQSGVPYYINRNHYAAAGSGRSWWSDISTNNRVKWDLAYDYEHWPNTQEYQINIQNNNPNDYLVDFWIDDGFGNNLRYEFPTVPGTGGNYNMPLLANRLNFTSVAANSDYLLYIYVTDVTNLGPPGMVDVLIDDADSVSGVLYNSPGNMVIPGGTWDNAAAPANLPYWVAHNYLITIN